MSKARRPGQRFPCAGILTPHTLALLLVLSLLVTSIGLHSLLREGGWLRERIDRLRTPQVKRGRSVRRTSARCANTAAFAVRMPKG